jgi:cytoskeleton protein RodZ
MSSDSQVHMGKPRASVFFRPKPDGEIDPAGEVGWFLQRERERRRERLHDAGRASGVHPHHLDALEAGDLTRLPPRRDTLRLLEAYALHLGFDPEPLLQHYAQFLPQQARTTRRQPGAARPFGSAEIIAFPLINRLIEATKGNGGIVASICGAAFLFAAASWILSPSSGSSSEAQALRTSPSHVKVDGPATEVSSITSLTEEFMKGDSAETRDAAAAPASPDLPEPDAEDAPSPAVDGIAALIARETGTPARRNAAASRAPESEEQAGGGRLYGSENADSRLVLRAKAKVWIRIEDEHGKVILTKTLLPGDSYRVPNRDGLMVIARDGGLISYAIDGVDKGQLGNPGEILVGRSLDLRRLTEG